MNYCCDDEELPEDGNKPETDISAIAAAAFDGDPNALALLRELADDGDLGAIEYAELADDDLGEEEG